MEQPANRRVPPSVLLLLCRSTQLAKGIELFLWLRIEKMICLDHYSKMVVIKEHRLWFCFKKYSSIIVDTSACIVHSCRV